MSGGLVAITVVHQALMDLAVVGTGISRALSVCRDTNLQAERAHSGFSNGLCGATSGERLAIDTSVGAQPIGSVDYACTSA